MFLFKLPFKIGLLLLAAIATGVLWQLAALPAWVLYVLVGLGAVVWVPWQLLRRGYSLVRATAA